MMKNKLNFLTLIALLGVAFTGHAQRSKSAFGVSGGYVPDGFGIEASFNHYHNRTDFIKIATLATLANEPFDADLEIPYQNYLLNAGYYTALMQSPSSGMTFAVGAGISFGYESINNGEQQLSNGSVILSESGFVYGLTAGADYDVFLSSSISLFVPINFIYQFNSDMGNNLIYGGLGLRYSLTQ
ncbi:MULTISPECIES: conjugal transfer protein TraO [Flavobacteriaceae]|uniref:conjugal transfer protein TraO n=1 Tax=Flavobacteriaceae TaxID=49546 RepID=UPI00149174AE|nr:MULTISPECIES: conjugal transfer protein TraO [Allomuricauda]MDC6367207.1 conjugal transfer protein TraO [Muricauda sp. AC10]